MNNTIIPVTYNSVTGGLFLATFLKNARKNIHDKLIFSPQGQVQTPCDFPLLPGNLSDLDLLEDYGTYLQHSLNDNPPYFAPLYIKNLDLISDNFEKIIRITYNQTNIDTLVSLFIGLEVEKVEFRSLDQTSQLTFIETVTNFFQTQLLNFSNSNKSNVLYITFDDLLNQDAITLINRLATFTGIPTASFADSNLTLWRAKMNNNINEFSNLLP